MAKTAIDVIRQFCSDSRSQRIYTKNCTRCKRFRVDRKQRKYKFGCTAYCPEYIAVLVGCGFDCYDGCEQFLREWEPLPNGEIIQI
jgi:hypothetical protein